jgi:signal transduction histidine kinase
MGNRAVISSSSTSWTFALRIFWLALGMTAICPQMAHGAPESLAPYTVDKWTLHLWHLDELRPPFEDRGYNRLDLMGLMNRAKPGLPSFQGMGSCVSFHHDAGGTRGSQGFKGAILSAAPVLVNGDQDNVPPEFRVAGEDGAFTIEALVRFDVLPADSGAVAMDIVSLEGDDDGERNMRVFNFRVESAGFLAFTPLSVRGGALAALPTTGPHAVNTRDWFHIAATYDGNEGSVGSLKLFWTRLDQPREAAHMIGSGTLEKNFGPTTGDFAIGNEGRASSIGDNAEQEPFRGVIDEVRISSIGRDPTDFLFVPKDLRKPPVGSSEYLEENRPLAIELSGMTVDGKPVILSKSGKPLMVPPGSHRLGFDFGIPPGTQRDPVIFRYRLKGLDDNWHESGRGMSMTCEVLDAAGSVVSLVQLPVLGASRGWETGFDDSTMTPRSEPVFMPESGKSIRITVSSGADDTTGVFAIDDLKLIPSFPDASSDSIWLNPEFSAGTNLDNPAGLPMGWSRGGSAPTIARVATTEAGTALALVDGDQDAFGVWTSSQPLPAVPAGGMTMLLKWNEKFNVIGGGMHSAIFVSVPAGSYTFEAIAASAQNTRVGGHVAVPFVVLAPLWERPWFWALFATVVVGSVSLGILALLRQRGARNLEQLRVQNALSQDRARIARDMHDDLGTRITRISMNVALAQRDLERKPEETRRHLGNLSASARDLVTSMDGLVWSVDPANDNLDQLAERLAGLADELFQDSTVRYAIDIPHLLPDWPLRAPMRNHLFLAVKEVLHNVLQHAAPCTATLSLSLDAEKMVIVIADTGCGFNAERPPAGNGVSNLKHRMASIGGTCEIESSPETGTRVTMICPLSSILRNPQKKT